MNTTTFLALVALGLITTVSAETQKTADKKVELPNDPAYGNMGYRLMTEDELTLELNDAGLKTYDSLDADGKKLAREVASARCNGTNACKGLNACADDKHSCAGKGECKGQGKCAFSDKNLAVKVVAEKMAKKRADLTK